MRKVQCLRHPCNGKYVRGVVRKTRLHFVAIVPKLYRYIESGKYDRHGKAKMYVTLIIVAPLRRNDSRRVHDGSRTVTTVTLSVRMLCTSMNELCFIGKNALFYRPSTLFCRQSALFLSTEFILVTTRHGSTTNVF